LKRTIEQIVLPSGAIELIIVGRKTFFGHEVITDYRVWTRIPPHFAEQYDAARGQRGV
jgi:hypothetical protein